MMTATKKNITNMPINEIKSVQRRLKFEIFPTDFEEFTENLDASRYDKGIFA
jgi:hypothetical protein